MQSLSHLDHLLMNMCRDLQALHREHVVIISLSHKVNAWRREVTTAWMRPVRLARILLRSVDGQVETIAHVLTSCRFLAAAFHIAVKCMVLAILGDTQRTDPAEPPG